MKKKNHDDENDDEQKDNIRARLIFFRSNISKGTAFLLQGMFETDPVAKVVTIKTVTIGYLKKAKVT